MNARFVAFAVPRMAAGALPWEPFLKLGSVSEYRKGSFVRAEGQGCFDLFYVEKGEVHVVFDAPDGRMRSVVSFTSGSMFNLAQAAARQQASGEYQCVLDSRIWRIPGALLHDPAFAVAHPELLLSIVEMLGALVLTHHTLLTDLLMGDFVERFCRFLVSLSQGKREFSPGLTQERLAHMLGVHRATLARAVQKLKQEGVISCFTSRRVCIADAEKLRHMAGAES